MLLLLLTILDASNHGIANVAKPEASSGEAINEIT